MQRLFVASFAAFALVIAAGCPKSPEGGKTDKAKTDKVVTPADKAPTDKANAKDATFKLYEVLTSTNVTQGGAREITIKIDRNNDFKQAIRFSAKNVPEKVKVDFSPETVKASDEARTIMKIQAEKDAAVAESPIRVEATPETGTSTAGIDVKINVKKQ
ncbi:MAG: hypothetical protein U0744_03550 [Gemmataceae bacterium]